MHVGPVSNIAQKEPKELGYLAFEKKPGSSKKSPNGTKSAYLLIDDDFR